MTSTESSNAQTESKGFSRRTVIKTAAWSVPVVAVAVSTPLAAASVGAAALTFEVVPLVDTDAPFGARALTVTNTGTADFTGPIVLSTPAWATIAPFTADGAVQGTAGSNITWMLPAAEVPAGQSLQVDLTWTGPYPTIAPEVQPLTATIDPALGSITPTGETDVTSPYQLLWFGAYPGGEGSPAGSFLYLSNTTETPFSGTVTLRYAPWTFPLQSVPPIVIGGTSYGQRVAENGRFVARYLDMPVSVAARAGQQILSFTWAAVNGTAQQQRAIASVVTGGGATLPVLGGPIYAAYRP